MPSFDPPGLHDLGFASGDRGLDPYCARVRAEVTRRFPGREVIVYPTAAPDPSKIPGGYSTIRIYLGRKQTEGIGAFGAQVNRLERVLSYTEDDLGQPGTGARYIIRGDEPPDPVYQGADQLIVGVWVLVYVSPTLVSAQDIEVSEAASRQRRSGRF
jgi:hypothetical protein